MKKILFLFSLCIIGSLQPMTKMQYVKNIAKKCVYGAFFNAYGIVSLACGLFTDYVIEPSRSNFFLLNNLPSHKTIIEQLNQTYSPNNPIKIYGPGVTVKEDNVFKEVNRKAVQAFALNDYVMVYAVLEEALMNPEDPLHHVAKAIVGHEIGHVLHSHNQKKHLSAILPAALTFYGAHKLLVSDLFGKRFMPLKILLAGVAKNGVDLLIEKAYLRQLERVADKHAIEHTNDSATLKAEAAFMREYAQKYENPLRYKPWLSTHPTFTERAQAFEKAAQALENQKK